MPCVFRMLSGPYKGKIFPVDTRRCLAVGNALEADFTIPDGKLKPFHCDVLFDSGRNGRMARIKARSEDAMLFVDGVPMDEVLLQSGDRMRIGNTTLEFLEGGHPDDPLGGHPASPGGVCALCKRAIPSLGGGRRLLNRGFCWRCLDLRLIVSRELGRYRILRKIDRGPCEIAYAAEDLSTTPPQRMALHVLKAERQKDTRVLRRFLTRAVFAYGVDHPVFARTRDLIYRPDVTSFVADLVEWPTLQDRLASGRPFELEQALRVGLQLAGALGYAREKGMIVGRLRPTRLLVSEHGEARIKDYWLAPEVEERVAHGIGAPKAERPPPVAEGTSDGVGGGTTDVLRYLVPTAKDMDHYNDPAREVRPVGLFMFQLATGSHPAEATMTAILERLRRAFLKIGPDGALMDLPDEVAAIFRGTLGREPGQRFGSVAALREGIERGLAAL